MVFAVGKVSGLEGVALSSMARLAPNFFKIVFLEVEIFVRVRSVGCFRLLKSGSVSAQMTTLAPVCPQNMFVEIVALVGFEDDLLDIEGALSYGLEAALKT